MNIWNRKILILALSLIGVSSMSVTGCQSLTSGGTFSNIYPTADAPTPAPTVTPSTTPSGGVNPTANGTVTLTWNASTGSPTGYYVYISTDNTNFIFLHNVLGNVTTYTATGLLQGTTYYFYVKAVNGLGSSAQSSTVSAAIP